MTTTETCGEHFHVGQSLQAGWPHSVCGRAKNHAGTHGLLADEEVIQIPDASPKKAYAPHPYEQGLQDGYISGLHKAAQLMCRACVIEHPTLSPDRITYPEQAWLHGTAKCSATPVYREILKAENEQ